MVRRVVLEESGPPGAVERGVHVCQVDWDMGAAVQAERKIGIGGSARAGGASSVQAPVLWQRFSAFGQILCAWKGHDLGRLGNSATSASTAKI